MRIGRRQVRLRKFDLIGPANANGSIRLNSRVLEKFRCPWDISFSPEFFGIH